MLKTWTELRGILFALIKKVSDYHYGDDPEFLRDYFDELIKAHANDLEKPIAAFQLIADSLLLN
jgi:hypothetical protein